MPTTCPDRPTPTLRASVLRWAREHDGPWIEDLEDEDVDCCALAAGGHLAVLQWVNAHGCEWDEAHVCGMAAVGTWRC